MNALAVRRTLLAIVVIGTVLLPAPVSGQDAPAPDGDVAISHVELQLQGGSVAAATFGAGLQWAVSGERFEVPVARVGVVWAGVYSPAPFLPTASIGAHVWTDEAFYLGAGLQVWFDETVRRRRVLPVARFGTADPAAGERLEIGVMLYHLRPLVVVTWTVAQLWD